MAHTLQRQYELVTALLEPLRTIFEGDADGHAGSQGAFDELLAANELELALHVACDFLLTHETRGIESGILTRIEAAHSAMGVEDACLSQLRLRYRDQPNAIFSEVGKDATCRNRWSTPRKMCRD